MRSFSKKLAFVLAAAMVVTAFAPAAKAEAAKEMAINKQGKILYLTDGTGINDAAQVGGGKGNVASYDFAVSNKPANYKETHSFAWSSSNPQIIKVGKAGLTTAVGVGKADVVCVVTEKATGKTTTLTNTITVKANAADVEIINAGDVAGVAYEVGAVVDLNRAMYDANGNKTTKRGTLVTDYTEWLVEPTNGVSINQKNGKYTFTEPGEYKLWCRTYQSSKYTKTTAESDVVKVTIADSSIELKQTTRTQFVIDGLDGVIGLGDVKVEEVVGTVMGEDRIDYLVKDVTMAADNKSATVELFYEFNDGGKYEVTVKGYDTEGMIASKGEPKSIHLYSNPYNIYDYSVLIGTDAKILYRVYDANGVDVTIGDFYDSNISYTIKYTDANYEDSADYLTFAEVGDKAVVTASFCSYETDADGNYTNEWSSKPFTFYGVDKGVSAVDKITDWAANGKWYQGDKQKIRMEDEDDASLTVAILLTDNPYRTIYLGEFGQLIDDTEGNEIGTAFFTSLNPDVIEVKNDGGAVVLEPRKLGMGRIMVSYTTMVNDVEVSTPIGVVTIEVVGKSVMSSVALKSTRVVMSTNPAVGSTLWDPVVELEVKDQYGNPYGYYKILNENEGDLDGKSALADDSVALGAITTIDDDKKLQLDSQIYHDILGDEDVKATAKTFQYTVKVQDTKYYGIKNLTFTVDARNPISNIKALVEGKEDVVKYFTTSYKLEVDKGLVDWAGGNVARIWAGNDNVGLENTKSASFVVWDMKNTAKYDELELLPLEDKKASTIESAATGAYYMVFKDGVNITGKDSVTADQDFGNGTKVTLTFSTTAPSKIDNSKTIVVFNTDDGSFVGGAGKYEFVYYEIKESNGKNKLYQKQKATINTTVDAGKYEFVKRTAVYANDVDDVTLLKCFVVKDRNGKTYGVNDVYYNGEGKAVAKINNVEREFKVNISDRYSNEKSVYVDSITFWEDVTCWGDAAYAEYTVEVGLFVDIVE